MPRLTRKAYAIHIDAPLNTINQNVARDRIYVDEDKLIDTEHPLNKAFHSNYKLNKRVRKEKKKVEKAVESIPEKKEKPDPVKKEIKKPLKRLTKKEIQEQKEEDILFIEKVATQKRKTDADARKAEYDAELKKISLEKAMGKLIPVDLMHAIFKINIQNVFRSFENELQNLASIYCDIMAGGDRSKLSEIVEVMRQNLARIINETKKSTAKEIEITIDDYQETRARGEKY